MSRTLLPVLPGVAVALALVGCGSGQPAARDVAPVVVSDATCRPTPVGRQTTGCYLTLTAPTDDRLTDVASSVAARAQIHESRIENNMMIMGHLRDGLPLPAGQTVTLAPGGTHIMLLAVTEPLRAGDTVDLTLSFATAPAVEIRAAVGQPPVTTDPEPVH